MRRFLVLFLLLAAPGFLVSADEQNSARGSVPYLSYDVTSVDKVNLFNGNLTVSLPLSISYPVQPHFSYEFVLHYNSRVWDYEYGYYGYNGERMRIGVPEKISNAGLGWRLSLGELIAPTMTGDSFRYRSPDGAVHKFTKLVSGTAIADPHVAHTEDATYLKLTRIPATGTVTDREISFPDGMIHKFDTQNRLVEVRDRYGNWLRIAYGSLVWTITNGEAGSAIAIRTHTVNFATRSNGQANFQQVVSSISLAAWDGQTSTWSFTYHDKALRRAFYSEYQINPMYETVMVPFLDSVSGPDSISYGFTYDEFGATSTPGVMQNLRLPTLGSITYAWADWEMSSQACSPPEGYYSYFPGVVSRTIKDASGLNSSATNYTPRLMKPAPALQACAGSNQFVFGPAQESQTDVTRPDGTKTTHHFSAYRLGWAGYTNKSSEYGYPFTRLTNALGTSGTRFLSTRTYEGTVAKISTYLEYENDGSTNYRNMRLKSNRTVHDADPVAGVPVYVDEARSSWDGYGHYRQAETTTSIPNSDFQKITSYRNYIPNSTNWLLGVYDYETTTLQKTDGTTTATRTDVCFPAGSAFPSRMRIRKSTSSLTPTSTGDQIVVYTRNTKGQLTEEQWYGGDANAVPDGTTLCTLTGFTKDATASTTSTLRHTYSNGSLATAQFWTQALTPVAMPFKKVDRTIDPRTGLVTTSRDTAGVAAGFEYDRHGRLLWSKPAAGHGAWTQFMYTPATSASLLAKVTIIDRPNGSTTTSLSTVEKQLDALGRLVLEKSYQPSGALAYRKTEYDTTGRVKSVSEREGSSSPVNKTSYEYDWADRVKRIHPPDHNNGSTDYHDVFFTWTGARQRVKKAKVALTQTSEADVETTETYDALGRLRTVAEPSSSSGTDVTTTYSYDVGGNLSKVSIAAPELGTPQIRLFNYDGRGVLVSEQHPELGVSGNGTKSYKYDAVGKPLESWGAVSLFHVKTNYDAAGRPLEVRDSASRLLKQFTYDGPSNGLGRLTRATRLNYAAAADPVWTVSEAYEYMGRDGRVSKRTTCINTGTTPCASGAQTFSQEFVYNDLGNTTTLKYPLCTVGCGTAGPTRDQVFGYSAYDGSLTSVTGFATSISYHPSGMINQVVHANGITTTQGAGAYGMARPSSIATSGVLSGAGNWSSGTYAYDGSGNIKAIGSNKFVYDKVHRVKEGSATVGAQILVQTYTYDSLGNRTPGAAAATNRSTSMTYDDGGNALTMGTNSYAYKWDGLNTMMTLSGELKNERYLYTADDERIGSWDGNLSKWTWRFRDLGATVIREFTSTGGTYHSTTWTWQKDHIHRNGSLLASVTPTATKHFHLDHLGTPRLITDAAKAGEAHSYYPFGQEATFVPYDGERMKFTGHERDDRPPSGTQYNDYLDYMHARYYNPVGSRFLSIDPMLGTLVEPQSWNRYSYVSNRSTVFRDPLGLVAVPSTGSEKPSWCQTEYCEEVRPPQSTADLLNGLDRRLDLETYTQVVLWGGAGWGSSSFGHASVIVNSTSYSFGPGGMIVAPYTSFIDRQNFRWGIGFDLRLSPGQQQVFDRYMRQYSADYVFPTNVCTTPIRGGLSEIGFRLSFASVDPTRLMIELLESGRVKGFQVYPPSVPATGSTAPWAPARR